MSEKLNYEIAEKCISYKKLRTFNTSYEYFLNAISENFLDGESTLFPYSAQLEITNNCNLRCKHCNILVSKGLSKKGDLTTNEWFNVIDQLKELGVLIIVITGGEPFCRKDILKIIKYIKSKNICLYIHSNGVLLKDKDIIFLKNILHPKMDTFQISLEGATKETHEKIRGKNTFDKTINNISKLIEANINVFINFTPITENYFEMPDLFKLCENLGVSQFACGKFIVDNAAHEHLVVSEPEMFKIISKTIDLVENSKTKFSFEYNSNIIEMTNSIYAEKYLDKYKPSNTFVR